MSNSNIVFLSQPNGLTSHLAFSLNSGHLTKSELRLINYSVERSRREPYCPQYLRQATPAKWVRVEQ